MSEIIVVIILSVTIIVWTTILRKRRKIVQDTSVMFKKLLELNSKYNFNWNIQQRYTFQISLPSKSKFDRYELTHLLDKNILNNSKLMQVSKAIENNRNLYKEYSTKINSLKSEITEEQTKILHISYAKYIKIEQKLFSKLQINPILDSNIVCIATYSSPKGRNHYSKTANYKIDQVLGRYTILQLQIANQNSEKMRKKRARSQMTDKLRYSILKRDGFKCKICGRTAEDGIKLHVDHIIPVSKGGETVLNNLRTLCETCNRGKSDEIDHHISIQSIKDV